MKIKLLLVFSLFAFVINAQWTSFTTPFSPYNGSLNSINVGSATQLVGVGDDIYGSGFKMGYKYDFSTNSWYLYHDIYPYNIGNASVAADGTVWTTELNGNAIYKNTVAKTGPVMKVIQSRSSVMAVGYNPTQISPSGHNTYFSNSIDAFTLQNTPNNYNMKSVDIGDDGIIWAVNCNPPPYYTAELFQFIGNDWVQQSTGTTFTDWESVAVGDGTKVLAVRAGLLYYKDPATGNFLRDFSAPAGVTQATIATDGTVFILASASNGSNVYKNTWSGILCGIIPTPTYAAGGNSIYICPGNTATFTASGSGVLHWYDTPNATIPVTTGTSFTTPALSNSATYYVENNVGGCKSNRVPMYVSMSAVPADPTNTTPTANLTICPGQSTTLTASAPSSGATENRWYATNTGTPSLGSGNSYVVPAGAVNATTTYYIQAYRLASGCVSNYIPVTITVSAAPSAPVNTTSTANTSICSGNSASLSVSGSGTINWYSDAAGTNLIQSGTSYTTPNLTTSTTYYTRIMGGSCNSAMTPVAVTVNQPSAGIHTVSACSSYQWINGQTYTSNNSTATHTLQNAVGCDSVVTLNLTILQPSATSFNQQACSSYTWNNQNYTSSGSYTHTYTNISGCDSVVTLNLTISQPTTHTITTSACNNYTLNGQNYTTSGTYVQNLTNSNGCDSTLTLNLTITNPSSSVLNEVSCGPFTLNNTTYSFSGTFTQIIPNAQGCDSTITLNLTVNNNSSSFAETACDSYAWNNQTYTSSGTYQQTFTNANGCDSVVTLTLTIDEIPTANVSNVNNTLTAAQNGVSYQWVDCNNGNAPINGATSQSFTPNANGSYAVILENGTCSVTSACTAITTVGLDELTAKTTIYPNPASNQIIIEGSLGSYVSIFNQFGQLVIQTVLNSDQESIDISNLADGVYSVQILQTNDTQSIHKLIKQ